MSWNKASFVQKLVSSSFCSIAIDDKLVKLTPFKKDYMNICQTPDLKIKIHQVYKNDIGNSDSPDRELFFILNQESYQSKILKFIFNGNEINLNIEDENDQNILNSDFKDTLKRKLGTLAYGSECDIKFIIEINKSNSIYFSVDIECQKSNFKTGLNIFDLAIASFDKGNQQYIFESNKYINYSIKRPLKFKEYIPIMLDSLYEYCSLRPHDKIYFIAHNGFEHDFLIIFDNLERSGFLDLFIELFPESIFLDSLSYLQEYKSKYLKIFDNNEKFSLSLTNLCHFFKTEFEEPPHMAKNDAQNLINLMCHHPFSEKGVTFLNSLLTKSYAEHQKKILEFSKIFEDRKKIEYKRITNFIKDHADLVSVNPKKPYERIISYFEYNVKGDTENEKIIQKGKLFKIKQPYKGILYKQLDAALHEKNISIDIKLLIREKLDFFGLFELGKLPEEEISRRLTGLVPDEDRSKIVDWCKNLANSSLTKTD